MKRQTRTGPEPKSGEEVAMRTQAFALVLCLCGSLAAAQARAELYQWTDEHGQVHVTDDASQVPRGQSVTVEPQRTHKRAPTGTRPSEAEAPQPPAAIKALALETAPRAQAPRTHLLHFERAGQEISLEVTVADRVVCNFKADTGASLNTLPRWAAEEMGLEIDGDTPTISLVGVSGEPMRVPVVTVPSVRVGTVYVENVEMAVLDTMRSGLLGMPFFNRFQVQIDPMKGELRLTEVDLAQQEGVYGGMGEDAWRQRFRQLHYRLAEIRKARESVPPEGETAAQSFLERLDREETRVQSQLDELDERAHAAGVPAAWR
jgi:hypothetical protein